MTVKTSKVVGLDLAAYKSGISLGDASTKTIEEAFLVEMNKKTNPSASEKERADYVTDQIIRFLKLHQPGRVCIEESRISFKHSTGLQDYYVKGNTRIIERYCSKLGIKCYFITAGSARTAYLGSKWQKQIEGYKELSAPKRGIAAKELVRTRLTKDYNRKFPNLDASDAALLVVYDFLKK